MSSIVKLSETGGAIIDGKAASAMVLDKVAAEAAALKIKPGLAVVLVGADPASQVYVKAKGKAAVACGFHSVQHDLPVSTSQSELIGLVETLNRDPAIHGILVQLPLPSGIDAEKVIETIAPEKDVDGFHPQNVGLLGAGLLERALLPCTPAGAALLIDEAAKTLGRDVAGANAVIVGRSNIVGKPMAQLLLARNATVTIAHSRTKNLPELIGTADILVAAVGRPEFVKGEWVKPGAIVIDVGINRIAGEAGKTRLVGDVAFAEAQKRAGAITPVPGGVGPMTIAMLMANTARAARLAQGHAKF